MKAVRMDYLKLNKNILIAFAASITVSAIVAQMLESQLDALNTTYTLAVDYAVYFGVFGTLHYLDNRDRYGSGPGAADGRSLRRDLVKTVSSLGIAEVIYSIMRWFLQYYLLADGYDPYLASLASQGMSTVVYLIAINISVRATRLYGD